MTPELMASLAAALIGVGIVAGIAGFRPAPPTTSRPRKIRRSRLSRSVKIRILIGLVIGIAAALLSGWIVLIPLVPLALVGLPYLLGTGGGDDIQRLDALDEWARSLAGVLGAGVSLEQAIASTQASAPVALKEPVDTLVARLRSRMSTEEALRLWADEINDTTADKMAAALISGARRRSVGLVAIMEDLAESVAEDVAARRLVQAERAKQTTVVRLVTLITLIVFGGFLLMGGEYIAPYGTASGQPILALLVAAYVGVLVWLRRMTSVEPLPRILGGER